MEADISGYVMTLIISIKFISFQSVMKTSTLSSCGGTNLITMTVYFLRVNYFDPTITNTEIWLIWYVEGEEGGDIIEGR